MQIFIQPILLPNPRLYAKINALKQTGFLCENNLS